MLDLLLGRFPGDCEALALTAAAALEPAHGADGDAALLRGAEPGALEGCEAMVLALIEQHESFAEAAKAGARGRGDGGGPPPAAGVHGALCVHAGRLFQARRFAAAARFYTAALDFADVRVGLRQRSCICFVCLLARGWCNACGTPRPTELLPA